MLCSPTQIAACHRHLYLAQARPHDAVSICLVIVAQCLACVCVCMMDTVFIIQLLEATKVCHNRLLRSLPLDWTVCTFISGHLSYGHDLISECGCFQLVCVWCNGANGSFLSILHLQPCTSRFYLYTVTCTYCCVHILSRDHCTTHPGLLIIISLCTTNYTPR